jgi:UDP-N-acetylmuramoyl-L-alanyl-D-glutamate--2,6-diaminopimelate ligase
MKTLKGLLKAIKYNSLIGVGDDFTVTELCDDSRRVIDGAMFVAVRGTAVDGHDFINRAIADGAKAIVCEEIPADTPTDNVAFITVDNAAIALGHLASEWFDNPSQHLTLVGVTGTNGKTTVATLLYDMARLAGKKAGLLSTVENRVDNKTFEAKNTTPGSMEINRLLAMMVEEGCEFAAMEVSSHGMVQNRTAGLRFAGGIFTNLTRDHLDYHKTFDAYLSAKKSFFDALPKDAFALVNIDDSHGKVMVQNTTARVLTYSTRSAADFTARLIENRLDGTLLSLNNIEVETQFVGRFNTYNLLAVFAASCLIGTEPYDAAVHISQLHPVRGRFETLASEDNVTVVVDYAHTPDALANVLSTIDEIVGDRSRIITVMGAGGNRDHGKRPLMGAEASRRSGHVIITSDNPRDEDPATIAAQVLAGVEPGVNVALILDRADAINRAIAEARPGDVVLIAGKGHETYQEFENRRRVHFDDREQALQALAKRK